MRGFITRAGVPFSLREAAVTTAATPPRNELLSSSAKIFLLPILPHLQGRPPEDCTSRNVARAANGPLQINEPGWNVVHERALRKHRSAVPPIASPLNRKGAGFGSAGKPIVRCWGFECPNAVDGCLPTT